MRGRNIFMGYLKNSEATKSVFDTEGYFHSGDIGNIDKDGWIEITGRIKELIITAGGENVSPIVIEQMIKEICPIISHAVVIGDGHKYLVCLITLR